MLPTFLIVGAQKSGTTTLKHYLSQFDNVWINANTRASAFFSRDKVFARGLEWYSRFFHEAEGKAAIGEKAAGYGYRPQVPGRISRCLPHVKLIWTLREPVARTYSSYWHAASRGNDPLSFEQALEREPRRIQRDIMLGYSKRSLYVEQVERYLEYFPREQMHFLLFERMLADPARELSRILTFLGVPRIVNGVRPPRSTNARFIPRSLLVQWGARHVFGVGTRPYGVISRWNVRKTPGYPPMREDTRQMLRERFREPNARLAAITGLDLTVWEESSRTR